MMYPGVAIPAKGTDSRSDSQDARFGSFASVGWVLLRAMMFSGCHDWHAYTSLFDGALLLCWLCVSARARCHPTCATAWAGPQLQLC